MTFVAKRPGSDGVRRTQVRDEAGLPPVARHLTEQAERAIERADAKAATLGAAATAILAFTAQGGVPGCSRYPSAAVAAVPLIAGALCWVVGIVALAVAVFPRFSESGDQQLTFFNYFRGRSDPTALQVLIRAADADPERWLLAEAHALSRIAVIKYRFIRLGMWLLGAGAASALCGVLLA